MNFRQRRATWKGNKKKVDVVPNSNWKSMPFHKWASQVVLVVKNPPANEGDIRDSGLIPGLGRYSGESHSKSTPLLLPGESYGWRNLESYGP